MDSSKQKTAEAESQEISTGLSQVSQAKGCPGANIRVGLK
jgi:hypothetical protein